MVASPLLVADRTVHRVSGALDPRRKFSGRLRVLSRPAFAGHAAGGHRRRLPHPHLFRRLHVGRRRLLPLLRLPEPVHVLHADAGAGQQLPADVHRLGRRGTGVVSADRILVHQRFGRVGRQESVHRQPHRRLRLPDRAVSADPAFRIAELRRRCLQQRQPHARRNRRRRTADRDRPAADGRRLPASRRRFRSMSGCRTRWKARRRSPR